MDLGFRDGANLTLGDLVWNDANDNGSYANGESLVPGVTVDLFTPWEGSTVPGAS